MSGTIGGTSGELGGYGGGVAGTLLSDSANVKQQLDTLLQQASSGYDASTYAGLGDGATTSLQLTPQLAEQQTWQNTINAATGQMDVSQTALTQISSIASTFLADTADLTNASPSYVTSTAADAQQALQQVAELLDTTDGSTYVFGGDDSSNPPVPDPQNILSSGFFKQMQSTVAGLAGNGAAAVISGTLAIASSNAAGTSPFSAAMSQPAATLQAQLPSVATGPGQQAAIGIPASANAFVASTGTATTGSYMRDILCALATIGSLSSSQVDDAGFSTVVSSLNSTLTGAVSALNQDAGVLGNTQSNLATEQSTLQDTSTALQTQLSSAQSVNMTQTLSDLTQTQTQLQASYQLISGLQTYSLAKFLTPTT